MRLTLRTLLAYLDDILEPAQTKEIGAKISESAFAMSLATRIKEVMRQRRLTAPELVDENGLDPNTTAEYLDNTLPPDDVAEVEKKCLESDVHLAEVSASHQILTLVLGEPVEIAPETRERMYALINSVPTPTDGAAIKEPEKPAPAHAPKAAAATLATVAVIAEPRTPIPVKPIAGVRAAPKPHAPQIPAYLRQQPMWRRALPVVVIAGIAAVFFWAVFNDKRWQNDGSSDPNAKPIVAVNDIGNQDEPPDGDVAKNNTQEPLDAGDDTLVAANKKAVGLEAAPQAPPLDDRVVIDDTEAAPTKAPIENPPAIAANAAPQAAPPNAGQPTPGSVAAAVGAANAPPAPGIQPPAVPAAAAPAPALPAPPAILYNSPGGILLRYDNQANANDWFVVPHRAVIHPGERIASAEPFSAQLDVGADEFRAVLHEGTAATILPPTQAWLFGFDISRGRVSLRWAHEGAASSKKPEDIPSIGFQVDGDAWRLKLMSDDAVCGIDVIRRQPNRFELLPGPKTYTAVLFVVGGTVRVEGANGQATELAAGNMMALSPIADANGQGDVAAATVEPIIRVPVWLGPDGEKVSLATRRDSTQFEREFQPTQPLNHYMPTVVTGPKPRVSQLAVQTLALTESVDALVTALLRSPHEESRVAAIDGLRTWVVLSPDNVQRLRDTLKATVGPDDADLFAHLIWGYSKDDARNVKTSRELVELMGHENLAIRELAFYNVLRLTGRRLVEYRADLNADRRRSAVKRWLEHVDANQGLIRGE